MVFLLNIKNIKKTDQALSIVIGGKTLKIIQKKIKKITLDYDGVYKYPIISEDDYKSRLSSVYDLMEKENLTHVIVYGDREHFSNMFFLSGYDPRFEESLLVITKDEIPTLIVGNEGWSYADCIPYEVKKQLYQNFSLLSQPRNKEKTLEDIFKTIKGMKSNSKVGIIGWKYFNKSLNSRVKKYLDIPYYIAQEIIILVGIENVRNVSDFMCHPDYGLRIRLDVKELVLHEIAGSKASAGVYNVIKNLRTGISELEASNYLNIDGDPLTAHPTINFGRKNILLGLASPQSNKKLEKGDVINISLGYRRSMVAHTGLYVENQKDIPENMKGIVENFYKTYYEGLVKWYESIEIEKTGGQVFQNVQDHFIDLNKYGINLNPGHLIHTDEWTESIFYQGSNYKIKSGMAIQCDVIAFPGNFYIGVHIEDGIIIADYNMRNKIKKEYPASWRRIQKRRNFVINELGIKIADEVLPTSNIQAVLFPFTADTSTILAKA